MEKEVKDPSDQVVSNLDITLHILLVKSSKLTLYLSNR